MSRSRAPFRGAGKPRAEALGADHGVTARVVDRPRRPRGVRRQGDAARDRTGFRFGSGMTPPGIRRDPAVPVLDFRYDSAVASRPAFPQVATRFPTTAQEGNRKPVDPGERLGNSGLVSTRQDHDQA